MPSKKKRTKNKRNDARGYQTGPTPIVRPPPQPKIPITSSVPALLAQLKGRLDLTLPPSAVTATTDTQRFRTRFQRTVDRLLAYGFTWEQVGQAVSAVNVTTSDAYDAALLDWLCWHLEDSLPSVFRDDATTNTVAETASIDVIAATAQHRPEADDTDEELASEPVFPDKDIPPLPSTTVPSPSAAAAKEEEVLRLAQQKAWLVSQYALLDEEEGDKEVAVTAPPSTPQPAANIVLTESFDDPDESTVEQQPPLDGDPDNTVDNEPPPVCPDEVTLAALQTEHDELRADLANEANNYMRSKHDMKALRQQLKQLAQRIQKMKGRVAKAKAERQRETVPPITSGESNVALVTPDQDDEEEGGGAMLDLFGDAAPESAVAASVDTPPPPTLVVPPDHIPAAWTGTTPRRVLEDWCRKENTIRPPHFSRGGTSVKVWTQPTPIVIAGGPNEHVVAAQALYQAVPQLPLYRLFPPFYRDLWLSWVGGDQQAAQAQEEERLAEYDDRIARLLEQLPTTKTNGTITSTPSGVVADTAVEVDGEDVAWDEDSEETHDANSNSPIADAPLSDEGLRLQKLLSIKEEQSTLYKEMFRMRQQLPIYKHRDEILTSIRNNPVTIICAETGSGKTTQCSSYILEQAFAQGVGDTTSVLCTQPRRVAAVSVSERVAEELGEESVGRLVGYSIRGETRRSAATRLLFCTTGVILRRLMDDPALRGISHVVVDEVHERQWQIDILLVILRSLMASTRPDLKVILMSATLDPALFSTFFANAPVLHISGRTFPVQTYYLEDLLEQTHHVIEEGSQCAMREGLDRETVSLWVTRQGGEKRRETSDYIRNEDVSGHFSGYSLPTQRSLDLVDESVINYDLIEDVLVALEKPDTFQNDEAVASIEGSVLVFMPGIAEIRTLVDRLSAVIDSGRVREIQRDRRTSSRKLVPTWCSRASAKVDARVGKMLIYGTVFRCIDPILTIAASLSTTKDPFLASQQGGDGQALAMHKSMSDTSSDFLSFINLWDEFRKSRETRDSRKFAREKFVSFPTLMEIQDNRSHFAELLYNLGFLGIPEWPKRKEGTEQVLVECLQNENAKLPGLVDAVVCAGLFPNVGKVLPKSAKKETIVLHKNERLTVQRSVNSKLVVDERTERWLVFSEKFATQHRVSVSKTALVTPLSLMLFGSQLEVLHTQRKVRVDGWIELRSVAATTGLLLREVRLRLDGLLQAWVDRPSAAHGDGDGNDGDLLGAITQLLSASSLATPCL